MKIHSYLALGDSYTVGEQVHINDSFPYQTVQLLKEAGLDFNVPEIIATTGWATDELIKAIDSNLLPASFDFVSLLIGVNNQYRGRSVEEFRVHFRILLELAIQSANGIANNVIVMSIPDWGVTPFAVHNSPEDIRSEIDMYNFICQAESEYYQTNFIDITTAQRQDASLPGYLAPDMLHPSDKEYAKWAVQIRDKIIAILGETS